MKRPDYVMNWKTANAKDAKRDKGLRAFISKIPKDTFVVYSDRTAMTNDEVQDIADHGRMFPGRGSMEITGEQSHCHSNVAGLYQAKRVDTIVTGFALSKDGLWREHTWGLKGGRVVETTERRVKYFGMVLEKAAALEFVDNEMW